MAVEDDNNNNNDNTDPAIKTPKFQTKIHLPEIPGSFTFKKNGKYRLDQRVKKFCLLNQCRGCFEVKVHFGIHTNPNKIRYDATAKGIEIDTLNDQQKFKLFVPYPKGFELSIPANPEAEFNYGILSAKLAIVKYGKDEIKRRRNNKTFESKQSENADIDESPSAKPKTLDAEGAKIETVSKKTKKRNSKKKQKRKRPTLDELNKRIASNNSDDGLPKKKRKLNKNAKTKKAKKVRKEKTESANPNVMNVDDQHKLIDGVVDKIEIAIKEKRQKEMKKDEDIKEYLANRAQKKQLKQQKKKELREKFLQRRMAKKKPNKMEQSQRKSAKKVRFNV